MSLRNRPSDVSPLKALISNLSDAVLGRPASLAPSAAMARLPRICTASFLDNKKLYCHARWLQFIFGLILTAIQEN